MENNTNEIKFGFLREDTKYATSAGIDAVTGLGRTSLLEYLNVIFPDVADWIHDKTVPAERILKYHKDIKKYRPDYRSDTLNMIIEFDGIQHYTSPDAVINDIERTKYYESIGYKVVRIPYFIQLTNLAVKKLFNISTVTKLFPENVSSLSYKKKNTPAYLCPSGIVRMAKEFIQFPEQYKINIDQLNFESEKVGEKFTFSNLLDKLYNNFKNKNDDNENHLVLDLIFK